MTLPLIPDDLNLLCNKIAKDLIDKLPENMIVKKINIREKYSIPQVQSALIFAKLELMGFPLEKFSIVIPKKDNIKFFTIESHKQASPS